MALCIGPVLCQKYTATLLNNYDSNDNVDFLSDHNDRHPAYYLLPTIHTWVLAWRVKINETKSKCTFSNLQRLHTRPFCPVLKQQYKHIDINLTLRKLSLPNFPKKELELK